MRIVWTKEAQITYTKILDYLSWKWGDMVVEDFLNLTEKILSNISKNPYMYKSSKSLDIRIGIITKHNSLVYRIKQNCIELITFWDNRQNPSK